MDLQFKYAGQSAIVSTLREARAAFATNTLREATFFRGTLGRLEPPAYARLPPRGPAEPDRSRAPGGRPSSSGLRAGCPQGLIRLESLAAENSRDRVS